MAGELEKTTGQKTEIFAGRKGSFEVVFDGDLLFSKLDVGRFPELEELLPKITQ